MFLVEYDDGRRRKAPFSYLFNFLLQLPFFLYINSRINVGLIGLVTAPALSLKTSLGFTSCKRGLKSDFS